MMAILAPVLFLGLVEGGLRLFGYGHSTNFFVKNEATDTYTPNEKFSWRFYSPEIAKHPLPFSSFMDKTNLLIAADCPWIGLIYD